MTNVENIFVFPDTSGQILKVLDDPDAGITSKGGRAVYLRILEALLTVLEGAAYAVSSARKRAKNIEKDYALRAKAIEASDLHPQVKFDAINNLVRGRDQALAALNIPHLVKGLDVALERYGRAQASYDLNEGGSHDSAMHVGLAKVFKPGNRELAERPEIWAALRHVVIILRGEDRTGEDGEQDLDRIKAAWSELERTLAA